MSYKNVYVQKGDDWNQYLIHLWTDIGYEQEEFHNYGYKECSHRDATHSGLRGEPLQKVYRWKKDDPTLHYSDHTMGNIHTKYLIDKYGTDDTPSQSHIEMFQDIEIKMGGALTPEYIKQAPMEVTAITYWVKQLDQWETLLLDEDGTFGDREVDGKKITTFRNERDLLSAYVNRIQDIRPDIMVGWNSDYFDVPYLFYRIRNVLGNRYANALSPIGVVEERHWDEDQPIRIAGMSNLDLMRLHKKYSWKEEPNYKLDYLGLKYVGQGKVEYDGSLDRLFKEDPEKFAEYSFVDVLIMKLLEDKWQYLDLTKNLAHKGKIMYEEVHHSSRIHDGAISAWLLSQDIAPPNKDFDPIIKKNYAGGYLFCPTTGLYNYMFDEDLTSLYPSIIMSLNIGKETYVGRIIDPFNDRNNRLGLNDLKAMVAKDPDCEVLVENPARKSQKMRVKKVISKIEDNNLAISANGVMFRTDVESVLSVILSKWFDERVEYKRLKKEAWKAGDKAAMSLNHLKQYTMKILLNSLYGATALPSFRYGNVILSEAITLSGQRIIQESALFANRHINKVMRGEEKLNI